MRPVTDANPTFDCVRIEFVVTAEVFEEGLVWSAHSQLNLRKFGEDTKEAKRLLGQHHLASNSALSLEHIYQ